MSIYCIFTIATEQEIEVRNKGGGRNSPIDENQIEYYS